MRGSTRLTKPFSGRIIVFDLQVHDGADPGESVGKDPKQSAIAQAGVRGYLDRVKQLLTSGGLCLPNPIGFVAFRLRRQAAWKRGRLGDRAASLQSSILPCDCHAARN